MAEQWHKFRQSFLLYSFLRDPVAIISFITFLILVIGALGAPFFATHDPYNLSTIDLMDSEIPPQWMGEGKPEFMLGTDTQGRDLFSTILYGMRVSIMIGVGAVCLQAFLGVSLGLLAGYYGGIVDSIIMRVADVQLSFSTLLVAIFMSAIFQAAFGLENYERIALLFLIVVIGLAEWPQYARTVRASVLAEKKKEYVEAVRVIGLKPTRIMFRHIFPNTISPILVISTVQVANAIMSEAALSFLGLGMPISKPSLGSLINAGFEYFFSGIWWITLFPGIILVVMVLVINLLGDWIRDVLNPKLYKY